MIAHDALPRVFITRARQLAQQRVELIATRTRARQEAALPILRRTRSQHALEVAITAAAEFDRKYVNPQRLASQRFPKAVFETALAVMDIKSGKMMKHHELITHTHQLIRERWTHSSVNKFGCLFQGVRDRIKSPTNTCFFHPQASRARRPCQGCHLWKIWVFCEVTESKWTLLHKASVRRQSNPLWLWRWNTNGQHVTRQNTVEQRSINTRCKIHDNQHLWLLPQHWRASQNPTWRKWRWTVPSMLR